MAIEIVDLPSYKMVMFHSYVSLPEDNDESTFSPRLKLGFQTTTKPGCEPRQGPKILSTIGKHIIDCLRSQQSHS